MPKDNSRNVLILTCTIDVGSVVNMVRADIVERERDYLDALLFWIQSPVFDKIIVIENSASSLEKFKNLLIHNVHNKKIEFLSFDGQYFSRHLGKGYGEILALKFVLNNSNLLNSSDIFFKVNGRYKIPNISQVINNVRHDSQIYFNLNCNMTFSDSRFFGGDIQFLRTLCEVGERIDESAGVWFEHILASAALHAIADGHHWQFITVQPIIEGFSGTMGTKYKNNYFKNFAFAMFNKLKELILSR